MVDALHEAHRVLRPGGLLIDARPDSRVLAYAERKVTGGYRRVGDVATAREELGNDRASDLAVAHVKKARLFRSARRGRFWHRVLFDDLDDLRRYLAEHRRFTHRARWRVNAASLRRWRNDSFALRRGVRYEVLERLSRSSGET